MAGATAAVGFLPGYAAIGVIAPVILILLRAAQGLAAGGELGVAGVFILERAKTRHRGELASWHTSTLALGLGSGMALAALLFVVERANPAEHGWWRLAFVLALLLGLVGMFVRRRVSETSQFLAVWQARETIKQPVPTLWANYRLALIRGFALIAAGSLAVNTFFIFMPNHLAATMRLDTASTLSISALTLLVAAAAAVTLGRLSDLVGRRPVAIRSTGMALSAGLATALIGGTAPVVDQLLVTAVDVDIAPGLYVSLVACLALLALWRWPETAFKPTI